MKRAIINLKQVTKNIDKPNMIFFNKIAPTNQVKIPDDKNTHPPLSRPTEGKKEEGKKEEGKKEEGKKEEKYDIFLL